MIKKVLTLVCLMLSVFYVWAWVQNLTVEMFDGLKTEFDAETIKKVYFEEVPESQPENEASVSGKVNGYDYVDLELPSGTKWATCNVGAKSPEEYGDYFAWSETSTKKEYTWSTYKWCEVDSNEEIASFNKYCAEDALGTANGTPDGKKITESDDDAVTVNWNSDWRMPTDAEMKELVDGCDWEWTNNYNGTGVAGRIGVSKKNKKVIFLPAAGNMIKEKQDYNTAGFYWTSSRHNTRSNGGAYFYFEETRMDVPSYQVRYFGQSVRGVVDDKQTSDIASISGQENGYDYVDLELPSGTKWATCNVGAKSPEEYGDYFAWSETSIKKEYTWSTYKWCEVDSNEDIASFNKYCAEDALGTANGTPDGKKITESDDDAATVNWNSNWRMPTDVEMKELVDGCDWKWTDDYNGTGVAGRIGVSKKNQKVIFLPAAGNMIKEKQDYNTAGFYWTSSRHNTRSNGGAYFYFEETRMDVPSYQVRYFGQSVRGVVDAKPISGEASVSGKVCGYDYVDLGLPSGTKWATYNVGAKNPEEYGDYFAWGETKTKNNYSWETYKWCDGDEKKLTKYCTDARYGKVDNITVLEAEDDAATVNWCQSWRIPTNIEQTEMINGCDWKWTTDYKGSGIAGLIGISKKNKNVIFFPASGYRSGEDALEVNDAGLNWSSSMIDDLLPEFDHPNKSCSLIISSALPYAFWASDDRRCFGFTVRAITNDDASQDDNVVSVSGQACGYDYVDLGLPSGLKWATYNVGASKPQESGDYFAWGETSPKNDYSYATHKWISEESQYFLYSAKDETLELEDDAAFVNWGGNWRMPNFDEQTELRNGCTWKWVDNYNGSTMSGLLGTSINNKNKIFFPASGYIDGKELKKYAEEGAFYTSSWNSLGFCHVMYVDQLGMSANGGGSISNGRTIRAVISNIECDDASQDDDNVVSVSGQACGFDYVDLGLPSGLKWATYNVGASNPQERGDYFTWGEISPKDDYSSDTYKWRNYSKYNTMIKDADNKYTLDPEDDAASANWGGKWRMPTFDEQTELRKGCTWKFVETYNGMEIPGMLGISIKNGKKIFFPALGYIKGKELKNFAEEGFYASSSLDQNVVGVACYSFSFSIKYETPGFLLACPGDGMIVRAVISDDECGITYNVSFYDINGKLLKTQFVNEGNDAVAPQVPTLEGYVFTGWNKSFSKVSSDLKVTAKYEKIGGNVANGHEYVDLCLPSGTKWAKCNIGATKPEEYGQYFAWGEVSPAPLNNYSKSNCSTAELSKEKLINSLYVDSTGNLSPSHDAATRNWGDVWKMPTKADFDELLANCKFEWTTLNDVYGYKVSCKSGGDDNNWIFLPASGFYAEKNLNRDGKLGDYWSSSVSETSKTEAYYLYFTSADKAEGYQNGFRNLGASIRPVLSVDPASIYTVSFFDVDGKLITSQSIKKGSNASAPQAPVVNGYRFVGWDKEFSNVQSDLKVTAQYEKKSGNYSK